MELLADLMWQCWILAFVLVMTWVLLLWRGNRKVRLWFAVLSPVVAIGTFMVGSAMMDHWRSEGGGTASCGGLSPCTSGGITLPADSSGPMFHLAELISVNALLAFLVAVPLVVLTVIIELARIALARRGRREPAPATRDF